MQIFRLLTTDHAQDFTKNDNYSTQLFFFLYTKTNIKFQNGKSIKKNRDQPQKHFCFKIKIDLYFVAYTKC